MAQMMREEAQTLDMTRHAWEWGNLKTSASNLKK